MTTTRISHLEAALGLALNILGQHEPPDSRAVSDEFVAMASVLADCANESALQIIEAASLREHPYQCPEVKVALTQFEAYISETDQVYCEYCWETHTEDNVGDQDPGQRLFTTKPWQPSHECCCCGSSNGELNDYGTDCDPKDALTQHSEAEPNPSYGFEAQMAHYPDPPPPGCGCEACKEPAAPGKREPYGHYGVIDTEQNPDPNG